MEHGPLKLLLIEDDAAETRSLLRLLARTLPAGSTFLAVPTLAEGLTALAQGNLDAVVLDLGLPDSQGLETLERVCAEARRLAVIVLTGYADERLVRRALECGVQEYLVKGEVNAPALTRNIRHAVERKRGELALQGAVQENTQLAAAVANVTVGVIIVDAQALDWPIVFANPAFSAITGYPRHEILGCNCRFLQGVKTDRDTVAQLRVALRRQQPFRGELLNYKKDGTPFWNEAAISLSSTKLTSSRTMWA